MERKEVELKVIEPVEDMDTEHNERSPQSTTNEVLHKKQLYRQTQNQENIIMMTLG